MLTVNFFIAIAEVNAAGTFLTRSPGATCPIAGLLFVAELPVYAVIFGSWPGNLHFMLFNFP